MKINNQSALHEPSLTRRSLTLILLLLIAGVTIADNSAFIGEPMELSKKYKTGDQFMGVRLLGTLNLSGLPIKGLAAHELSGLAWDEDDQILYAVSDKGYLLHLRPFLKKSILNNVELLDAYRLKNTDGEKIKYADSEGLDIINGNNGVKDDAQLVISFEVKPKITRYSRTGEELEEYKLPKGLDKIKDYDFRNSALESLIIHPDLGILTAPQMPLKESSGELRSIHDLNGKTWQFKPHDIEYSSITDLEKTEDGSILILERRYSNILAPIQSIIRRIRLDKNDKNDAVIPSEIIALFESTKGWKIDNFEGLAHHKDNKYFMISDDNNNIFQRTLLVYFELID